MTKKSLFNISINIETIACILLVVFVILKLFGAISWSWLWVLSPLWIGLIVILVLMVIVLLFLGLALYIILNSKQK